MYNIIDYRIIILIVGCAGAMTYGAFLSLDVYYIVSTAIAATASSITLIWYDKGRPIIPFLSLTTTVIIIAQTIAMDVPLLLFVPTILLMVAATVKVVHDYRQGHSPIKASQ